MRTRTLALKIMIALLTAVTLFHISVITQLIPYTIVWAGKLNSLKEMYVFEAFSILSVVFLLTLILLKQYYLKREIESKILNGILWLFIVLFALNTLGNLFAKTMLEKVVFTPLTLISAILIWLIVRKGKELKE